MAWLSQWYLPQRTRCVTPCPSNQALPVLFILNPGVGVGLLAGAALHCGLTFLGQRRSSSSFESGFEIVSCGCANAVAGWSSVCLAWLDSLRPCSFSIFIHLASRGELDLGDGLTYDQSCFCLSHVGLPHLLGVHLHVSFILALSCFSPWCSPPNAYAHTGLHFFCDPRPRSLLLACHLAVGLACDV